MQRGKRNAVMMKSLAAYMMAIMLATAELVGQSARESPIQLKFIGIVKPKAGALIAVITDAQGQRLFGRAGDVLKGRYRILRVDAKAIEVELVEGSDKRTIQLTKERWR